MSQENEESMFVAVCLVSSAKTREYHSLHTTHIKRQAQKYPTLDFMKYYMHISRIININFKILNAGTTPTTEREREETRR